MHAKTIFFLLQMYPDRSQTFKWKVAYLFVGQILIDINLLCR